MLEREGSWESSGRGDWSHERSSKKARPTSRSDTDRKGLVLGRLPHVDIAALKTQTNQKLDSLLLGILARGFIYQR